FALAALRGRTEANWPVLVYPGLCAAAGAFVAVLGQSAARLVGGASVALGAALALGDAVELRIPRVFAVNADPVQRFPGGRDPAAGARRLAGEPVPFVLASNYQIAAELAYYGGFRRFGATFRRRSQFDLWGAAPPHGERLVMVSTMPSPPTEVDSRLPRSS